jgi:hypothetical protein
MLAHLQEEDAQGEVSGVARIGDVAIPLHGTHEIVCGSHGLLYHGKRR